MTGTTQIGTGARQETHRREVKVVVPGTGRDTGTLKTVCEGLEQQSGSVPACPYLVSYFSATATNPDSNHPMGRWGPSPSCMVACTHLLSHYLPRHPHTAQHAANTAPH